MASLPNLTEKQASALIDNYFPPVRPTIEKMWKELAEEMKAKADLKKTLKTA